MTWLNWPNRITICRIALIVPFVICLLNLNVGWAGWRYLAIVLFALMAISDALDGFLARQLGEETPLGRFLDPVGDKLLIASAVVLLSIDATAVPNFQLPSFVPVIAVGKDVLTVIGFGLVYATTGEFFVQPRVLGKACTLVQLVTVGYCLVAPDLAPILPHGILWVLCWLASALAVVALIDYVRIGNRFAAEHQAKVQGADTDE
jgi:CDP-diacylglycerol--glycerol-3-phosphate 3-phosphatidyltransferase